MVTFILGLVILVVGAAVYGKFCEKVFGPDDRETPAYSKQDGVDYVPMKSWKNMLINLLNIAGTGPIFGPIQGILFGPIAFITIPIGNIIGGTMHDYFSGMICLRDGGAQMPEMIRKYSNKTIFWIYQAFVCLLLLLVGAVFIYTPGDIAATQVFGFSGKADDISTWVIYGVIFLYYLAATVFPIDAVIGKIYPMFGGILLFSAVGVFGGIFLKGMNPPAGPKTVEQLSQIAAWAEVPYIVKGVMTVKGPLKAKEAGAAAIVVSNHGGRVLDQCPATAEVLCDIVDALRGSGVKVIVDGGIRTGVDVFKALAMGADAVIICRPFVPMVYGGGEEAVKLYIDKIGAELEDTMAMCGAKTLADINRDMVFLK